MQGMGCALSTHQKECWESLGCALFIGVRYLPENMVILKLFCDMHVGSVCCL
jgi:hypothetical protein